MRFLFLFAFLFFCHSSYATPQLGSRLQIESTVPHQLYLSARWKNPLWETVSWQFAVRPSFSFVEWEKLQYMGEIRADVFSFLGFALRLNQTNRLPTTTATSTLSGRIEAQVPGYWFFASFGILFRFHSLQRALLFPTFFGSDYQEYDYLASIGFRIPFIYQSRIQITLSSWEELDVYNIHNPYLEIAWMKDALTVYVRYHTLLGFGRNSALAVGVSF
jgi:hypothetical protein